MTKTKTELRDEIESEIKNADLSDARPMGHFYRGKLEGWDARDKLAEVEQADSHSRFVIENLKNANRNITKENDLLFKMNEKQAAEIAELKKTVSELNAWLDVKKDYEEEYLDKIQKLTVEIAELKEDFIDWQKERMMAAEFQIIDEQKEQLQKQTEIIDKMAQALEWIKDKAPFCDCMDAPSLAAKALAEYEKFKAKVGEKLRTVYKTPEEFKAALKVGDFVTAWSTGRAVQITAIGEKDRFLAVDVFSQERVQTMTAHTGWEKIDQPDYWEAEEL